MSTWSKKYFLQTILAIYGFLSANDFWTKLYVKKPAIRSILFLCKKCVTEKRSKINQRGNLLTVFLSITFNKLPWNEPRDDWAPAEEAEHFLKALKRLQLKLEEGKIDYFFDDNSNILWKNFKQVQLQNMVNFLKKAIKDLETSQNTPTCKTVWTKYFTAWFYVFSSMYICIMHESWISKFET